MTKAVDKLNGFASGTSVMVSLLAAGGSRLGSLVLMAQGENLYNERHLKLFSILNEPFSIALNNALRYFELGRRNKELADDVQYLQKRLIGPSPDTIIGRDSGLKTVMEMVRGVAPMESPVLLQGETGVGKEIVANAIHALNGR